jgi:hypothetical protein
MMADLFKHPTTLYYENNTKIPTNVFFDLPSPASQLMLTIMLSLFSSL